MHTHIYTQIQPLWGGPQKFPVRKAGRRNTGNNWVSEKSLGPSQSHFQIQGHCLLSCCCVGRLTGDRNNSPSGSPSSFVDKEASWHHSVTGWNCCWYTKRDGIDLSITHCACGHCFKTLGTLKIVLCCRCLGEKIFLLAVRKHCW